MLLIKMTRSMAGTSWRHIATLKALGLRKMHQVVEHDDTPSIRGMVAKVAHMVQVTEVDGSRTRPAAKKGGVKAKQLTPKPKVERAEEPSAAVSEQPAAKAKAAEKPAAKAKSPAPKTAANKPAAKRPSAKK